MICSDGYMLERERGKQLSITATRATAKVAPTDLERERERETSECRGEERERGQIKTINSKKSRAGTF